MRQFVINFYILDSIYILISYPTCKLSISHGQVHATQFIVPDSHRELKQEKNIHKMYSFSYSSDFICLLTCSSDLQQKIRKILFNTQRQIYKNNIYLTSLHVLSSIYFISKIKLCTFRNYMKRYSQNCQKYTDILRVIHSVSGCQLNGELLRFRAFDMPQML